MQWVKVNDNDPATLPPMEHVVWIIYTSGYDGGPIIQLGGRGEAESVDDDTIGWAWGALDGPYYARNWESKLFSIEVDDDYNVTHWAEIEWPEDGNHAATNNQDSERHTGSTGSSRTRA